MGDFFVQQKDAKQCGIACLAMVCRHYGRHIGIDDIEPMCPSGREGVSMLALSETADALGLENVTAKFTPDRLAELPLPCILHWNHNHFVVLRKIGRGRRSYHVADPGKGLIRYSAEEFAARWGTDAAGKGIAMALRPTDSFMAEARRAADGFRILASGCENLARAHQRGAPRQRRGKRRAQSRQLRARQINSH
ncbi:MAG: ABC transporter [Muribaculaceae bacterium]|nr:ABC transporter [Muribaculaceae bacterium]